MPPHQRVADDQRAAPPPAKRDLAAWIARVAPEDGGYEHDDEGPDDMPAHLRATLTGVSLSIPVIGAAMALDAGRGCTCSNTAPRRSAGGWRCM
ncbi:YjbQ family protein [Sphingomonas sp. MMS24-JH45]